MCRAPRQQLTWLALDELGKANLLEAEVARPRPLPAELTRRQMLTTFATAGAALAVVPMVALVTTQARAEALPATPVGAVVAGRSTLSQSDRFPVIFRTVRRRIFRFPV